MISQSIFFACVMACCIGLVVRFAPDWNGTEDGRLQRFGGQLVRLRSGTVVSVVGADRLRNRVFYVFPGRAPRRRARPGEDLEDLYPSARFDEVVEVVSAEAGVKGCTIHPERPAVREIADARRLQRLCAECARAEE